jgi:FlgD Ig-like domain
VERSPHGRHTAGQSRQAVARARSWKSTKASRRVWVVALGAVTALVAAAITLGGAFSGRQNVVFAANSGSAPLMGASVPNLADLARDTAEFGQMGIYRVYYTGLPQANAWTTGLPAANHSAVIVSFNALPSAILSGADDSVLSHFFDTAPTGHAIYYSYIHEPEEHITDGQFTAAAYRAAWAHIVALANEAHNPYLHSTLIMMAYDLRPASHRDWHDYLPSGGIISTIAWDAYPPGANQLTPPAQFLAPEVAASKASGIPFGFAEFGVTDLSGRPDWLKAVGNYLMSSGALFGTLFDSQPPGTPDLILTDSPSIDAWRSIVTESDIQNGIGTSKPDPTPTPTKTTPTPAPAPSTPTPTTPIPPPMSPTPIPTASVPPPVVTSPEVSGLALSPAAVTASGQNHATISFRLTQDSDVTVLILNSEGAVVRTLTRPAEAAGGLTVQYYGYNGSGQREPAGNYQVLIVASNANGSGTAETPLTINAP